MMEEKIQKYINDEMSSQEREDFETMMKEDASLCDEVQTYRIVSAAFKTKMISELAREEVISDYVNDEMSDEYKDLFEKRLAVDEKLQNQVKTMNMVKAAFMTKQISSLAKKSVDANKKSNNSWRYAVAAAAACLIIPLSSGLVACSHNSSLCHNELDKITNTSRGSIGKTIGLSNCDDALELFNSGDVDGALKLLDEIEVGTNEYSKAMYVKGIIMLDNDMFNRDAVRCLKKSNDPKAKNLLDKMWFKFLY